MPLANHPEADLAPDLPTELPEVVTVNLQALVANLTYATLDLCLEEVEVDDAVYEDLFESLYVAMLQIVLYHEVHHATNHATNTEVQPEVQPEVA